MSIHELSMWEKRSYRSTHELLIKLEKEILHEYSLIINQVEKRDLT